MLVEFKVRNFRSIKDEQVLSMVASSDKELPENLVTIDKMKVLKTAAVYGANASGKSNLIQAFNFMQFLVKASVNNFQKGDSLPAEPFLLNTISEKSPSMFEATFYFKDIRYRYGFEVTEKEVVNEWLFYVPNKQEKQLFYRNSNGFDIHADLKKEAKGLTEKTRDNALFLSVLAQFNSETTQNVIDFFSRVVVIHGDIQFFLKPLSDMVKDKKVHNAVKAMVRGADLQINDFRCEEEEINFEDAPAEIKQIFGLMKEKPKKQIYYTKHDKYNEDNEVVDTVEFMLDMHESEGTKQIFYMTGPLIDVLSRGGVLIVDELEMSLHPLIVEMIVNLFNKEQVNKSQLIFSTHNTKLLSKKQFRRDQIWFTEKSKAGATELHSLYDFSVRKDASYEKDYLLGKYGAIPYHEDISESFNGNG